jgi:hypothetical protein
VLWPGARVLDANLPERPVGKLLVASEMVPTEPAMVFAVTV